MESKAIELILGPDSAAYMKRQWPGNTPEKVAWVAMRLLAEWKWLELRKKQLEQAQADLDMWQDLADPQ